jgi:hypothetical protein
MKTKITIPLIGFLFVTLSLQAYSQPKFVLNLYGGVSLPLPQLQGEVATVPIATTFEKDYGMRLGFNFGADGKYAFDKKGNIRGVLSLGYNIFMNPGEYKSTISTYKYNPQIGIFTASLGIEYAFLPKEKYNPFLGVDITANFFNGSFDYDPLFPGIPNISLKSESRFGIQFNGGAEFKISKSFGIVAGAKLNLANLIGKDADTSSLSTTTISSERSLNDKEYTYRGTTVSAKNIFYFQVYAGVSFFFGEPKKIVKK